MKKITPKRPALTQQRPHPIRRVARRGACAQRTHAPVEEGVPVAPNAHALGAVCATAFMIIVFAQEGYATHGDVFKVIPVPWRTHGSGKRLNI